ncbi:MAG: UPF0280 family protein [Bacteroidaceae bacterium]
MEYRERFYRSTFSHKSRQWFPVKFLESDLWIGVDKGSLDESMPAYALDALIKLRRSMDDYLLVDPTYKKSLVPYDSRDSAPTIFKEMSKVSHRTGIGPMGAVAGAVAKHIADMLMQEYQIQDLIIENGGDIWADVSTDVEIAVFAGESPLSGKVGLHIPKQEFPLGICTSSGTVGPSLSFGKADAVMIVCRDVLLADSYATAMANKIQTADDLQPVIEHISANNDILGALAVKDDRMAVCGRYELRLFK